MAEYPVSRADLDGLLRMVADKSIDWPYAQWTANEICKEGLDRFLERTKPAPEPSND